MTTFIITLAVYYVTSYAGLTWVLFAILREVHRIEKTRLPWALYLWLTAIPYVGIFLALFVAFATCVSHVFNQARPESDEHK